MTTTNDRVRKLLIEHLGVDAEKVTDDAIVTDDLGADSLDLVEVEMAIEDEFGFRFGDQSPLTMEMTVADLCKIIEDRLPAA